VIGMFTYQENLRRLEALNRRIAAGKADDEDYANAGELRAWLGAVYRAENPPTSEGP
jgi:hypothetical protein